ncbi:MAG: hypothetical protein RR547_00560 [Raoultibacter sp.]
MKKVFHDGKMTELNSVFPELIGSITESLIINGKDTFADFGLILLHDFELSPPEPKIKQVDIPGGDGTLDLTEVLTGDVSYSDRKQRFSFRTFYPEDFEAVKSRVSNFLHGRLFDYKLSWDSTYTYTGRFRVSSYSDAYGVGMIDIEVIANPYKLRDLRTLKINAAGGVVVNLTSGRKRVCPTFDVNGECEIYGNGALAHFYRAGAYKINDLWLTEGNNQIYINTYFGPGTTTWADLAGYTWKQFSQKRFCEWMFDGSDFNVPMRWCDLPIMRWRDFARIPFDQWRIPASKSEQYNVYVQYEWSDL